MKLESKKKILCKIKRI